MHSKWRVEVFGGLRAVSSERTVTRFRSRATGSLLGYLAVHLDQMQPREALVERLWPGCEPQTGFARLSTALWALRREMEGTDGGAGSVLVAERAAVGLNAAVVSTDAGDFESTIQVARRARDASRGDHLVRAVRLYRGDFLAGYYDDWVGDEQRRYLEMFFEALHALLDSLQSAGRHAEAIEYACLGVERDPLRETTHRSLMRLYLEAGQPALALRQFRELENALARELDTAPTEATRALAAEARRACAGRAAPADAQPRTPTRPARAATPPEGTVTFLFSNAPERCTQGAGQDGAAGTNPCLFHELLRRQVPLHGGVRIRSAAGVVAAFACAEDALSCAAAAYQTIHAREEHGPAVCPATAVDTGRAMIEEGTYRGAVLSRARGILKAAHPGQVLCSERAAALAQLDLDPRLHLADLGVYRLARAAAPEHLIQVEYPGMPPSAFPLPNAPGGQPSTLPRPLTRFFGRDAELERIQALLAGEDARLLTLLGPSGIGKTRLALEAAKHLAGRFEGAVWFVPLLEITDPARVPEAVVQALGLPTDGSTSPLAAAAAALRAQPGLLVLDNLEHLLPDGAHPVQQILEAVPALRCLVTSRQRLGIAGEREFAVGPLPTPSLGGLQIAGDLDAGLPQGPTDTHLEASPEQLLKWDSVRLFLDRAQVVLPDFRITDANAAAVARLCAGLEGIPLALELAASRAGVLAPAALLERMEHRFELLTARGSDPTARHCSLQAAVESTLEPLSPELRRFFCRLSVFRSGWTLKAAEAVCAEPTAADHLAQLQECSVVTVGAQAPDLRFRMLETLREFAQEELSEEEREALRSRHADYCLALAARANAEIIGPRQSEWLARLDAELGNIRAVMAWTLSAQPATAMRIATLLGHYWEVRGYWDEGIGAMAEALRRAPDAPLEHRARAAQQAGWLQHVRGDHDPAQGLTERALGLFREMGDAEGVQMALYSLGRIACYRRKGDEAHAYFEESAAIARDRGDLPGVARALHELGDIAAGRGDFATARALLGESLALSRQCAGKRCVAHELEALAGIEERQGDPESALRLHREALGLFREVGDTYNAAATMRRLGASALRRGHLDESRALLEQAVAGLRDINAARHLAGALRDLSAVDVAQGDLTAAERRLVEALALYESLGDARQVAQTREALAALSP